MKSFASKYASNLTSQNGENGIIRECLNRINPSLKIAVEFGAPDQMYCSNIYPLKAEGWDCFYFDNETVDPYVTRKEITEENVNELPNCSVLSMDTDGLDYFLWTAYKGKPDIVIIEINSSLPPMVGHFTLDKGASYITMLNLGIQKGYFLLVHTGNMVFIRNEHRGLFPEIIGDGVENYNDYFKTEWL